MSFKHIIFKFIFLAIFIYNPSNSFALMNNSLKQSGTAECTDQNLFLKAVRSIVPKGQGVYERIHHICFNPEKNKIIIQAAIGENNDDETLYLAHADKSTCKAKGVTAVSAPLPAMLREDAAYADWDFRSVVNCIPYAPPEESDYQSYTHQRNSGAVQ